MNCCILRTKRGENTAGLKAPDDVATIFSNLGFRIVKWSLFPTNKSAIYKKIWLLFVCNFQWLYIFFCLKKGDYVIYQHPAYGYRISAFWVEIIRKVKKATSIALIHDLESLRKGIEGAVNYNEKTNDYADNKLLSKFDFVISHNEKMSTYLKSAGVDEKRIVNLQIFDYLTKEEMINEKRNTQPSIAIAGNLSYGKCKYIYDITTNDKNKNLVVNLYGINYEKTNQNSNYIYHGSFSPNELPKYIRGDFGLVWDGISSETCKGNTGEYLRYNNPHKTSLYLCAGIPVIVWDQAAIADFVLQNRVGIVIDNLAKLETVINGISDEEYNILRNNARIIGNRIRSGHYLIEAFKECEKRSKLI